MHRGLAASASRGSLKEIWNLKSHPRTIELKYTFNEIPRWTVYTVKFEKHGSKQPEIFSSFQLFSHVRHFATPWAAACQASLSISNFWSLLKLISIELVMPSTISSSVVPFSPYPQCFPASGSFQMSQLFASGGQSIGVSASTSVLPMNTQDWSSGWTGCISLQSEGLSRVFSNTTVQKHQFFGPQFSL